MIARGENGAIRFDVGGGDPLELGGWAGIDGIDRDDQREAERAQMLEHASYYRQAFTTDAGRRVLQEMIHAYLLTRVVRPEQDERHDAVRQGQQDVVIRILKMIEFANTGGDSPGG
jgi:hypothetical protein